MASAPNRFLLIGYLEEALPGEEMARVEELLRVSADWRAALLDLRNEVDLGEHSVATIWRRHRLTCSTRERLGAYIMNALPPEEMDYIQFHLNVVQCRSCQANLTDLRATINPDPYHTDESSQRRQRCFQTSIHHLPRRESQ